MAVHGRPAQGNILSRATAATHLFSIVVTAPYTQRLRCDSLTARVVHSLQGQHGAHMSQRLHVPPRAALTHHPQIDYEKLAQLSGLGTKGSATTAWCVLKKKLNASSDGNSADSTTHPATPKSGTRKTPGATRKNKNAGSATQTPSKRKAAYIEDDGNDDDDDEPGTSLVEKRGKKARGAAVKTEESVDSVSTGPHGAPTEAAEAKGRGENGLKLEVVDDEAGFLRGLHQAAAGSA
nr:hypothetical protein CFP56_63747 [Quercus suber]